jgi:ubiquinol-cytochrome c reductase cytochrome c subunit
MAHPTPSPSRPRRRRAAEGLFVIAVLAIALALTTVAWDGDAESPPPSQTVAAAPAVAASTQDQFQDGERVFLRDCAFCHGDEGEGSERGPSLEEAGPAAAHFQLTTGRMPLRSDEDEPEAGPPAYPPQTIEALVTYVGTLGRGPEVPEVLQGDAARGRTLFLYNCAPCHSSSGTGMILPAGDFAPELSDSTFTQVAEAVRLGPGSMPPFSESHLDKEQVDAIATYVQQLDQDQNPGGHPLDWIGPIYEGSVAWLLALPLLVLVIRLLGTRAPARRPGSKEGL